MNTSTATTRQQILFIDSKVDDLDQLIAGFQPNTAVYVLHPPPEKGIEIKSVFQPEVIISFY
ncbi:MAG: hypothetical protein KA714_21175 [Limnoraphis sp. WC205]|jgi:hypothetical protein|nr:hypothetical protein [Limnoraphis sp. WC205]